MDETEKYKQRLEAIAEKRRLQEEQEMAKREMEDEKLRLQQLKRKSLRDQWLMEGAPLSPTSLDSQSPRSPLWGSPAQEMEKRIEKLESESQRLAEEEMKLKEDTEDGQTEVESLAATGAELLQDAVVPNGEKIAMDSETTEVELKMDPRLEEVTPSLTNGQAVLEVDTNQNNSQENNQPTSNGTAVSSEAVNVKTDPGFNPGPESNVNIGEEEEEGTVVIRAERVIITDEGDDVAEETKPQEDQSEIIESEETHLMPNIEANEEQVEAEGTKAVTEVLIPGLVVTADEEVSVITEAAQPDQCKSAEDREKQDDLDATETGTNAEGHDVKESEESTSEQVQHPSDGLEGTIAVPVPVYSEEQLPTPSPKLETESATDESTEGPEATLPDKDPVVPGQFQDVPLEDPQESPRTGAGPDEQEPLLTKAPVPSIMTPAKSQASTETPIPSRDGQREEFQAPNRKGCQCCSVM